MTNYCIILTTTDDLAVAKKITLALLEKKLAACVQIDDVRSYFTWHEKITSAKEYRVAIKTKSNNYKDVEKIIVKVHNYQLPQIIQINIDNGSPEYLDWISNSIN